MTVGKVCTRSDTLRVVAGWGVGGGGLFRGEGGRGDDWVLAELRTTIPSVAVIYTKRVFSV